MSKICGISTWLFKRRIQNRRQVSMELIRLTIDFWVALYIIVPAVIFIGSFYLDWLHALPAWYLTDFQGMWPALFASLITLGIPRTYLERADLVLIYPNRPQFKRLMIYGQLLNIFLKSLPLLVVLFFAYPFFHHVQGVDVPAWLLISTGMLVLKFMVLNINWHLGQHLGRWPYRLYSGSMITLLYWGWYRTAELYIVENPVAANIIIALLAAITCMAFIKFKFRINDWEAVVAEEEHRDIDSMRLFLGNAAQVEQQGSSKQVHIGKGRMGIAFRPSRVFTYFFVKYFSRKKKMWQDFGQFYALAILVLLQNIPFWIKLVFMLGILLAMAGMLQLYWKEHSEDLFLRMLPMKWDDIQQSIKISFYIILGPLCLLFLLVLLTGKVIWWNSAAFILGLFLIAGMISRYMSLNVSVLFNYHEK